jgi:hypothetical protein
MPVSVETLINNRIETPISQSDTWAKIASGRTDAIDRADKAILYALIRHLEARSPHYFATTMELAHLANSRDNDIPFSEDEYEQYAAFRTHPEKAKEIFNLMALSLEWTEKNFMGSGLAIFRSPIPLRSSSIPVMSIKAPYHPSLHLPLAGMMLIN